MSRHFDYIKPQDALPPPDEKVLVFMRSRETGKIVPRVAWIAHDKGDREKHWEFHHGWSCGINDVVLWIPIEIPDMPKENCDD